MTEIDFQGDWGELIKALNRRLLELDRRVVDLEKQNAKTRERADHATSSASASLAEIRSTSDALVAHLARIEKANAAEAAEAQKRRDEVEEARKRAAKAHAERFDAQSAAIRELQAAVRADNKRAARTQMIIGAVLTFVVAAMQAYPRAPPPHSTSGVAPP